MLVDKLVHFLSKKKAIWLVKLTDWRELVRSCVWSSVEFDGQVRSVFAEQFAVVVVDGPERREVTRAHGGEEVLPPATLQDHQALQAPLGVGSHHLQTVRDVRLVEDPSEERGAVRGRRQTQSVQYNHCLYKDFRQHSKLMNYVGQY